MASSFPTSLDAFTNPSSTDAMDSVSVPHATQHSDLNDAVEALEAKVGADSSAVTSSHDYKIAQLEAGATGGKILQVVSTTKTDTQTASLAAGAFATVTGLSATITPSSTSSNILVMLDVNGSGITDSRAHLVIRVKRGSTEIGSGAAASSRTTAFAALRINYSEIGNIVNASGTYLDSPATTSPITYSVEFGNATGGTRSFCINRSSNDTDTQSYVRASSTITIMEVSA